MNRTKPCLQALAILGMKFLAAIIVPFVVRKIVWGANPLPDRSGDPATATIRGTLPDRWRWLETPDETLPGGLYEPTVRKILERYGKTICAWYWIGVRNRAHGYAMRYRVPMTNHFNSVTDYVDVDGLLERDGVWRYYKRLGPFCFVAGYRSYYLDGSGYFGTPVFTIKRA